MIDTTKRISKVTYNGKNIPVGPAQAKVEEKDVNFIDFDGTLLHSYTKEQAMALSALPDPPDHSDNEVPLTFDGWNWDLDEIKDQLTEVGGVVWVGATYYTTDGYDHIIVEVDDDDTQGVLIGYTSIESIDWGDGSSEKSGTHVYANGGTYDIKVSNALNFKIGGDQLKNCIKYSKVRRVYLSKNLRVLITNFANYCYALQTVTIPNGTSATNNQSLFNSCTSLKSVVIPKGSSSIGSYTFGTCYSLEKVSIPKNAKIEGNETFSSCTSLKSVTISKSTTRIASTCFGYSSLRNVVLPSSVTTIAGSAFNGCRSLGSISIPNSVDSIGSMAFSACYALQVLTIPSSVTSMEGMAFNGSYFQVKMEPTTPPTIQSNTLNSNIPKIIVPKGCLEAYQNATNWSSYASKMVEADE